MKTILKILFGALMGAVATVTVSVMKLLWDVSKEDLLDEETDQFVCEFGKESG